ncbi:MAG TPA: histidinol-phosphate transaminase, partial [Verrucomicrobiota bacterium]|nr:histidinol-phosphate transaminase [Verrucomicrobiota bacterium]
ALAVRAFVEPMSNLGAASRSRAANSRRSSSSVQYFWPSYSLYPVLAEAHGARLVAYPLSADFSLPTVKELRRNGTWDFRAALTFITTPHAPSGRGYSTAELEVLCRAMNGVVVLDEAYVDFADEDALELAKRYPHVLISRTFSKAYSLCFQRVGYFIGHPDLIAGLHRLRDSYNVNGLGQVAAEATLGDLGYYRRNFSRIKATRARLTRELTELGWGVLPSQTNFLLCLPPRWSAENWQDYLRQRKILVRWFNQPAVNRYLRITVGSEAESDRLLRTVRGRRGRSI